MASEAKQREWDISPGPDGEPFINKHTATTNPATAAGRLRWSSITIAAWSVVASEETGMPEKGEGQRAWLKAASERDQLLEAVEALGSEADQTKLNRLCKLADEIKVMENLPGDETAEDKSSITAHNDEGGDAREALANGSPGEGSSLQELLEWTQVKRAEAERREGPGDGAIECGETGAESAPVLGGRPSLRSAAAGWRARHFGDPFKD